MLLPREAARRISLTVAGARAVLGIVAVLLPRVALRPWVGKTADAPGSKVLARSLGTRDIALALGALLAARRGRPVRGWVEAAALADAGDTVATLRGIDELPRLGSVLVLAVSAGAAVVGGLCAASLGDAGDDEEPAA